MNRRGFLGMLGATAAGAVVASHLPAMVIAEPIAVTAVSVPPVVGMKGVPYIVNNMGDYFGISRSVIPKIEDFPVDDGWYESLPKDRSLIPGDYRRSKAV